MANRIRELHVRDHIVDATGSEIWITVVPEEMHATLEVRGRLTGPRCVYSTTIEVAFPLRRFPRQVEGLPGLPVRVLIPESSLWEPACPFLYGGPVELWDAGELCDRVQLTHGLRVLRLGPRGLRLNGRPIAIKGIWRDALAEGDVAGLHLAGWNTLLAPVSPETVSMWELADRFGFMVLGLLPASAESVEQAQSLANRASCIGWVLRPEWLTAAPAEGLARLAGNRRGLILGQLVRDDFATLPREIHFLAVSMDRLGRAAEFSLPKLILSQQTGRNGQCEEEPAGLVLGTIEDWPFSGS